MRYLSEGLIREGYKPMLITVERPDDITQLVDSLLGYSVAGMIFTSDTPPRTLIEDCGADRVRADQGLDVRSRAHGHQLTTACGEGLE